MPPLRLVLHPEPRPAPATVNAASGRFLPGPGGAAVMIDPAVPASGPDHDPQSVVNLGDGRSGRCPGHGQQPARSARAAGPARASSPRTRFFKVVRSPALSMTGTAPSSGMAALGSDHSDVIRYATAASPTSPACSATASRSRYSGSAIPAPRSTHPPATATKTPSCSPDCPPAARKKRSTPPAPSTSQRSDTNQNPDPDELTVSST